MQNAKLTLIRGLFSGLFPLMLLTLLASCQKENPIGMKEPQVAARSAVGNYEKKPASVRKPTATNITDRSARIEWQKASRAEEYIVLRRALYADNPESSLSPIATTSALSYDETGLAPQTEYIYRIVARNNVGEAQRSPHLKFGTLSEPKVEVVAPEEEEISKEVAPEEEEGSEEVAPEEEEEPSDGDAETESAEEVDEYESKPVQVSKPSVTDITYNSARIEWKKARRAQEYIVTRRALYADHPESSLSPVHTTSELSYDDTDLAPDTEFIYRIVARNNVGEAQRSSHLKFRTLPAPVGTVVSAELVGPEEPEEPEVEYIPEEEEEPLQSEAAHVEDHNTRALEVLDFRLDARSNFDLSADCSHYIDMGWQPAVHPDGERVTKHQYQIANEALYTSLASPTTIPWSGVDHVDIPDSGDGETHFRYYIVNRYQEECLVRGATYYLTIRSVFGNETSPSAEPQIVTIWSVPEAPVLTATAEHRQERIVLNWTAPEDFGADIWSYQILHSTVGPDHNRPPVLTVLGDWPGSDVFVVDPPPPTTYTHTMVNPEVTYYYWVKALNTFGIGPASEPASATLLSGPLFDITVSGSPTDLTAQAKGQTRIQLAWIAPAYEASSPVAHYRIEASEDEGSSWNVVDRTRDARTDFRHDGLSAGDTRYYRVSAVNVAGASDPSNVVSATTVSDGPAATNSNLPPPADVTAAPKLPGQIRLGWWTPVLGGGIDSYQYRMRAVGAGDWSNWTTVNRASDAFHSRFLEDLDAGTAYEFQVRSVDKDDNYSAAVSALATATGPQTISIARPSGTVTEGEPLRFTLSRDLPHGRIYVILRISETEDMLSPEGRQPNGLWTKGVYFGDGNDEIPVVLETVDDGAEEELDSRVTVEVMPYPLYNPGNPDNEPLYKVHESRGSAKKTVTAK